MADKMGGMLTLTVNDAAVRLLGLYDRLLPASLPAGIGPRLEGILGRGIVRRGQVVTWAGSAGDAEGAPAVLRDLTAWECFDRFHQVREGERRNDPCLDGYLADKVIVADISGPPAGLRGNEPVTGGEKT